MLSDSSVNIEQFVRSRTITIFAIKIILKLGFTEEGVKTFVKAILNYVFEKGFLKKAFNGALYHGMSLNLYMLLLVCMSVGSNEWRTEIFKVLSQRAKFALSTDAAKKNTILTYLGQIWHLMALLMLDEGAAKL